MSFPWIEDDEGLPTGRKHVSVQGVGTGCRMGDGSVAVALISEGPQFMLDKQRFPRITQTTGAGSGAILHSALFTARMQAKFQHLFFLFFGSKCGPSVCRYPEAEPIV